MAKKRIRAPVTIMVLSFILFLILKIFLNILTRGGKRKGRRFPPPFPVCGGVSSNDCERVFLDYKTIGIPNSWTGFFSVPRFSFCTGPRI